MNNICKKKDSIGLSPFIFATLSPEGIILSIDGGGLKKVNHFNNQGIGDSVSSWKNLPIKKKHIGRAARGENFSVTQKISSSFFETFYVPQFNENQEKVSFIFIYSIDVTARVKHETELDLLIFQRTQDLKIAKNEQREMLDNMHQAILTFDSDLKINPGYSSFLNKMLHSKESPVGQIVLNYLFKDSDVSENQITRMEFEFDALFGSSPLQWELSSSSFPLSMIRNINKAERVIKLTYEPIFTAKKKLKRVMIIMEDVTDLQLLEKEAKEKNRELEKISELLSVEEDVFFSFINESDKLFSDYDKELKNLKKTEGRNYEHSIDKMFRCIHTIKGNAGLFNLASIQQIAHEVEENFVHMKNGDIELDDEVHVKLHNQIDLIRDEIAEYQNLRAKILHRDAIKSEETHSRGQTIWLNSIINRFSYALHNPDLSIRDMDALIFELKRAVNTMGKTHIKKYINRFDSLLAKIARKSKKKIKPIRLSGDKFYFENRVIARISDILTHCLVNSIDHGIEDPLERIKKNKREEGLINIHITQKNETIELVIKDDGKGIDLEKIKDRSQNIISLKRGLEDPIDFIFDPGFSTSDTVSETSGRGVGMSAVREIAEELGGNIDISSVPDKGTTIKIKIPEQGNQHFGQYCLFDLKLELMIAISKINHLAQMDKLNFKFPSSWGTQKFLIFGDKVAVGQALNLFLESLGEDISNDTIIKVKGQELPGKRQVDSSSFFRINFELNQEDPNWNDFADNYLAQPSGKEMKDLFSLVNGKLSSTKKPCGFELNVPSHLPETFLTTPFDCLSFMKANNDLSSFIDIYFQKNLTEIKVNFFSKNRIDKFLKFPLGGPKVIWVDQSSIEAAAQIRPQLTDYKYAIILVTEDTKNIDPYFLNLYQEAILVISPPLTQQSVSQIMELAILQIFSQFHKEKCTLSMNNKKRKTRNAS